MKQSMIAVAMVSAAILSACAQVSKEQRAAEDHYECFNIGFRKGTVEYGNCRLTLRNQRIAASQRRTPGSMHSVCSV